MKVVNRILCVVDPTTERQPARDRAIELARAYDAELVLYMSYFNQYVPSVVGDAGTAMHQYKAELLTELKSELETAAQEMRDDGLKVATDVEWHPSLYESIIEKASSAAVDLIVKDTHYHPSISRALFTNTDWNLIRECPVPLWLVKPGIAIGDEPRILAAVDPLHEHQKPATMDRQILDAGEHVAEKFGGELHAFHSYNPLVTIGNAAKWAIKPKRIEVEELSQSIRAAHEEAFDNLMRDSAIPESRRHIRSGTVVELLPALAIELGVSLVVLGAVTRKKLRRMLIGNTAEKIMDHVPCDLLVLKPV